MQKIIEAVIKRLHACCNDLWPDFSSPRFIVTNKFPRPYSMVYRLELRNGTSRNGLHRGMYVKIFKPSSKYKGNHSKYLERLKNEYAATDSLQKNSNGSHEFAVVKPLTYFPDLLALVTDEAAGQPLADLLEQTCKIWQPVNELPGVMLQCRRAGAALANIQKATRSDILFEPEKLLEYIEIRLQRLETSPQVPFTSRDRIMVTNFLQRNLAKLPENQLLQCGCHCDYGPFNILAGTHKATVIDFTMFKTGSIYNDVTYFHHRLEGFLHKPIFRSNAIHAAQRAFITAYDLAVRPQSTSIANDTLFTIFQIKHVINNYSATMRNRRGGGKRVSPGNRLFNWHIYQRYNKWLSQVCR